MDAGPTAPMALDSVLTSAEQLAALYRPPVREVAEKKVDHLEPWSRAMVHDSRLVLVGTADRSGRPTVSPKGGPEGFVSVLDDRHLALPDYAGNNLLDSLRNVIENPHVGLIFVMPGRPETFRVDGDAWVSTDPVLLDGLVTTGRRPRTAVVVRVVECFFHCPSSFNRGGVWDPGSWPVDRQDFESFIRRTVPEDDWPEWARP